VAGGTFLCSNLDSGTWSTEDLMLFDGSLLGGVLKVVNPSHLYGQYEFRVLGIR